MFCPVVIEKKTYTPSYIWLLTWMRSHNQDREPGPLVLSTTLLLSGYDSSISVYYGISDTDK